MSFKNFSLNDKSALITGAGGLLGKEHAAALLDSGAFVVLTDIDEAALHSAVSDLQKYYPQDRIRTFVMDVSSQASVKKVADKLSSDGAHIDILVNNAAIDPKVQGSKGILETSRLENFPIDQWNKQISVGLSGAFICCQVFGAEMANKGTGGVILNIASDLSIISPDQRLYRIDGLLDDEQPVKPVTYSVIKSGLVGLTRYLATYWVDKGIRCNALSPGGVFNGQSDEFVTRLNSLIPIGRMAKKNEYRSAVQFLCSDASSYMTGQNLIIDGGRSLW